MAAMTRIFFVSLLLLPLAGCGAIPSGSGQQCQFVRSGDGDHGGGHLSCANRSAARP